MYQDNILLEQTREHICTLTLNRPAQYNALSGELLERLINAFDRIAQDDTIRVVVLTANGKAFCAGHDLREMRSHPEREFQQRLFERCSRMMQKIVQLPQPVIAKVQGGATAAGCQLVATCDLAVAADECKFAVSGINLGLFCSTPAVALSRNVSRKRALCMLLTGEFIDSATAVEYGLINQAVAAGKLAQSVMSLAETIVAKPASAIRLGKRMYYQQLDQGLIDAYCVATDAIVGNMMLAEAQEGIDAFLEKRPPDWRQQGSVN